MKSPFDRLVDLDLPGKFQTLLDETPAEIFIVGGLLCAIFTGVSYQHEYVKQGQEPLAFSEIGHTRKVLGWRGMKVPALTMQYSATNDVRMQVGEANNIAYGWGWDDLTKAFAYEIEKKNDIKYHIHTLIVEYAQHMKEYGDDALKSLENIISANRDLPPVINALHDTWSVVHDDKYRTEHYTEEVCSTDSDGKEHCHDEDRTREVYDHTDHTYNYHPKKGRLAAALLRDYITKHPDIDVKEPLILAAKTEAENEWAIRESRRHMPHYVEPKGDEYVKLANTWATSSNYYLLMPRINQDQSDVIKITPKWEAAKDTAHDEFYQTYSHNDDGPKEYQISEAARMTLTDQHQNIDKIVDGIKFARDQIPVLSRLIKQFTDAELHNGPKADVKKLSKQINELSKEIYNLNFINGMDTYPAKWGNVFMWGLLGAALGGGLGALWNEVNKNRDAFAGHRRKIDEMDSHFRATLDELRQPKI